MRTTVLSLASFLLFFSSAYGEGDEGKDKAHFHVHNKEPGRLEIHTTKEHASITAVADSVQMVLDPGVDKLPEDDIAASTRTVKVADQNQSVKRDQVISKKTSSSKLLHKSFNGKRNFHHQNKNIHDATGTKKSTVDKEMLVHGQSGALHVHTDHNLTAVHSNSGKLEIYIKNPDPHHAVEEDAAKHHSKVSVEVFAEESYGKKSKVQQDPKSQFHVIDVAGVKKSKLYKGGKKQHNRHERGITREQKEQALPKSRCLVPPCSK